MLAYPIDEAEELLQQKLTAAKTSHKNCEEDLDFLREQITVRSSYRPERERESDPEKKTHETFLKPLANH